MDEKDLILKGYNPKAVLVAATRKIFCKLPETVAVIVTKVYWLYAVVLVTDVTFALNKFDEGCLVEIVALVAVSKEMLGLIIIIIPQEFVIVVAGAELNVVTEEKGALKLNTND